MNAKTATILGVLATFGAMMGVLADVLSAWSPNAGGMDTAFSVGLDSISGLFEGKPRWTYVAGNYVGVYFLPLHTLGFFLVYLALKPASGFWAAVFLVLALYVTPIGVGLHGSLAFIGDILRTKDPVLIEGVRDYWQPWAYSVVVGYAIVSIIILMLILTGRSLFSRWMGFFSPVVVVVATALVIAVLPDSEGALKAFLSVTGLNLPLVFMFGVTTYVLGSGGGIGLKL